jgi:hypothetical protein
MIDVLVQDLQQESRKETHLFGKSGDLLLSPWTMW